MGTKLLLADDSITIQKVVGIIFASEEYDLAIVDNGSAALVKAKAVKPDVLLVDAVMPGMTGYEVCEEIRRDPLLENVPILLLTGAFEPFDEEKARKSGADDFISKPFESQSLIDKVTNLISLGRQRTTEGLAAAPAPQAPPRQHPAGEGCASANSRYSAPDCVRQLPKHPPRKQAAADDAQYSVEMIEGSPEDDLWGAFELEDVAEEGRESLDEQFAVEEEPFVTEAVEDEPFSFAEELETVVEPAPIGHEFKPAPEETFAVEEGGGTLDIVSEDAFGGVFEEEAPAGVFETVAPEETFFLEGGGGALDIISEDQFGGVFGEEVACRSVWNRGTWRDLCS